MQEIKAGNFVIHEDYPELGPGKCTYISYSLKTAFIVWGKIGDEGRHTNICNIEKIKFHSEELPDNVSE